MYSAFKFIGIVALCIVAYGILKGIIIDGIVYHYFPKTWFRTKEYFEVRKEQRDFNLEAEEQRYKKAKLAREKKNKHFLKLEQKIEAEIEEAIRKGVK